MPETGEGVATPVTTKYATRIGKVLSKSSGGFSTALVYTPDTAEEKKHGSLYFVIEIGSASPLAPDIAYNLIDIIKEEYYRDLSQNPSASFETALKSANEEFAAIVKEGEKDWIGKTSIIVAAIAGNTLLAVQRGTSEIHLWRSGKIMHLSEGMYTPGETHKPEETLTNIIEGELAVGDKLIVSTAELFYYLSVEKLRRIVESYSPAQAAAEIAKQLGQESDINKTNVVIAEFSLPELLDTEEDTGPEDHWVGMKAGTQPEATPRSQSARPIFGGFATKKVDASLADETETDEVDDTAELAPTRTSLATARHEMAQELEMNDDEEEVDEPAPARRSLPKINYSGPVVSAVDKLKQAAHNPVLKKTGGVAWRYLKYAGLVVLAAIDLVVTVISNWVSDIKQQPNGNRTLIISLAVLTVVVVASTLVIARGNSTRVSRAVAVSSLEEAIQKRDAAKAALIYEDSANASTLLFEAYGLATAATKHDSTKVEAAALLVEINTQLDEVGRVKRFENPSPLVNFAALAGQLDTSGRSDVAVQMDSVLAVAGDVYSYDTAHNKVYKYNTSQSEAGIVNSLVSSSRTLKLGTPHGNGSDIVFYATPASMYSLTLDENKMVGLSLDAGDWNNAVDLIAYTNKLYFLDPDKNQIWRYQETANGYTAVAPYFEDNSAIDISDATTFAIDGNVYLLAGGVVKKYASGQQVEYNLIDVPGHTGALGTITDIYADIATEGVYVLDSTNSRVVVFNENGGYLRQYAFSGVDAPTKIFADEGAGYLWVLSGTQVYQFGL